MRMEIPLIITTFPLKKQKTKIQTTEKKTIKHPASATCENQKQLMFTNAKHCP